MCGNSGADTRRTVLESLDGNASFADQHEGAADQRPDGKHAGHGGEHFQHGQHDVPLYRAYPRSQQGSVIQRNAGKRMEVHKSPDKHSFYARCSEYSIPWKALPSFARDSNGMNRCRWVYNVSCMLVGRMLMETLAVA